MRNYLAEMLYALTSAYSHHDYENGRRGVPPETNIGKLFSVFAWGLDTVQEQAELIKLWDDLENARGAALDRYGANFGVKRNGTSDVFYRLAIRVKVIAQLSGGDTDTVIRAAAELLDVDYADIWQEDVYPAKVALYVDQKLLSEERLELIELIAQAIKRILAGGVGLRLYLRTYRTYRGALDIGRAAWIGAGLTAAPVSKDRESLETIEVGFGGFVRSGFDPLPVGEDRSAVFPLSVAHSAFQGPTLTPALPQPVRAYTGQQGGAGGVIYTTHIKPKRID